MYIFKFADGFNFLLYKGYLKYKMAKNNSLIQNEEFPIYLYKLKGIPNGETYIHRVSHPEDFEVSDSKYSNVILRLRIFFKVLPRFLDSSCHEGQEEKTLTNNKIIRSSKVCDSDDFMILKNIHFICFYVR
ncbi:hypothetical protein CWI36_0399p0010 [Hamiltosporidium magnivora]|uniref:Uncharacterized protein n=1 Tax=Hamiltosporidium magnivora TaxID=148818 RepID=A0A4Q9LF88_9MICR|nr:hypothetical protein CWI36_0399p0010 [Hamiltosporidium magnivora]